ncbi:MAG: hypothetical protein LC117_05305 [Bacteroidia bacterium]|nr:hypothetical protein [Bacteroidia bacterium]MCZ2277328.1 hypothetical protein [Bacteroidia bacterium]
MRYLLYLFIAVLLFNSCKKEDDFNTSQSFSLRFSTDTILFDTIFTTIGSTTEFLLVYNDENKPVKISSIRLANGNSSLFRLNVDGTPGKIFNDIEIGKKDSLWIFIEVTIDPNNAVTPFLVTDSILFETNGKLQDVDLVAFGQNANFITPTNSIFGLQYSILPCNSVWNNSLPYVIYGYAVVDSACTLTIEEGTQIHFFQNSGLWVYRYGLLKVNGTVDNPVIFQGTRLEPGYSEIPGQWDRIWINEGDNSNQNEINHAIIKNSFIGIQAENLYSTIGNNQRKLILNNTFIRNTSGIGILARDYTIVSANTVVANSANYLIALTMGGSYEFNQCTFANYWSRSQRSTPSVYLNNYYNSTSGVQATALNQADFKNCIIYGSGSNELELDFKSGAAANHLFTYTLIKRDSNTPVGDPNHFDQVYSNQDPGFEKPSENNYELTATSFSIDKGNPAYINSVTQTDLKGNPRTNPDLGAFEKQ